MKSWRILAVLLLSLASAGSMACNPFGSNGDEGPKQQLVEVVRGDLTVSVGGSGNIGVANEAWLAFGSGGKIDKIYVEEGDKVKKGEILANLDTTALELALAQAQAALVQAQVAISQAEVAQVQAKVARDQAKAARDQAKVARDQAEFNLEQLRDAVHAGPTRIKIAESQFEASESQLEAAESQLEASEAQVEVAELQLGVAESQLGVAQKSAAHAQKQLDEASIAAPFGGTVARVGVDEGDTVSPAATIIHLIDLKSMELRAGVDEIDIPDIELEQRVIISVDAVPGLQIEGKVSSISLLPVAQADVVMYEVIIGFDIPEDNDLKVGMSATIDIIVHERSNVLFVPNRAIEHDRQGKPWVKVLVGEQTEERPVVTGVSDGIQTEIVDGLGQGEVVVIELRTKTEPGGFLFQ